MPGSGFLAYGSSYSLRLPSRTTGGFSQVSSPFTVAGQHRTYTGFPRLQGVQSNLCTLIWASRNELQRQTRIEGVYSHGLRAPCKRTYPIHLSKAIIAVSVLQSKRINFCWPYALGTVPFIYPRDYPHSGRKRDARPPVQAARRQCVPAGAVPHARPRVQGATLATRSCRGLSRLAQPRSRPL